MSPDRVLTFRVDPELLRAMEALKARDGMPFSEQIRRSLTQFLAAKGVKKKTGRRRVATR